MTALCYNTQHRIWQQRLEREMKEAAKHQLLSSTRGGSTLPANPNLLRDEAFHHTESKHRIISERWTGGLSVSRERRTGSNWRKVYDKSTQISFSRPNSTRRLSKKQVDYDILRSTLTTRLQNRTLLPNTVLSHAPLPAPTPQEHSVVSTYSQRCLIGQLEKLLAVERKVTHR